MWCWKRMEKISWTDHVRNEVVLLGVKEQRNILHEISKRKANWIRHILRRNCLLKRVNEEKIERWIEVTGRRVRRRRKLLDDLKERRGYSHLNEEALDRTVWRARFGRGFGPVVRQINKWMSEINQPVSRVCQIYIKIKRSIILFWLVCGLQHQSLDEWLVSFTFICFVYYWRVKPVTTLVYIARNGIMMASE